MAKSEYELFKIEFVTLKENILNGEYSYLKNMLTDDLKEVLVDEESINFYLKSDKSDNKRVREMGYCKATKKDSKNYIMELVKLLDKESIFYKFIKNNIKAYKKNYMSKDFSIEPLINSFIEVATIKMIVDKLGEENDETEENEVDGDNNNE